MWRSQKAPRPRVSQRGEERDKQTREEGKREDGQRLPASWAECHRRTMEARQAQHRQPATRCQQEGGTYPDGLRVRGRRGGATAWIPLPGLAQVVGTSVRAAARDGARERYPAVYENTTQLQLTAIVSKKTRPCDWSNSLDRSLVHGEVHMATLQIGCPFDLQKYNTAGAELNHPTVIESRVTRLA